MKSLISTNLLAACAVGLFLVGCDASQDIGDAPSASDTLFAPASATTTSFGGTTRAPSIATSTVTPNASIAASTFPTQLQNTRIAAPTSFGVGGGVVNGLTGIPVPVVQQQPTCIIPNSKAALASYAANCAGGSHGQVLNSSFTTSRVVGPTSGTVVTSGGSFGHSPTFVPAAVSSCNSVPTSKSHLASYRANCLGSTSAPVRAPSRQRPEPAPEPVAAPEPLAVTPSIDVEIEQPTAAPATNAVDEEPPYDCSVDPSTGAELALFRTFCS